MATEREWKFHVTAMSQQAQDELERWPVTHIQQGYLSLQAPVVRVRLRDHQGTLTVKWPMESSSGGPRVSGEVEVSIPEDDARALLKQSLALISKRRFIVADMFEVDVFEGSLEGLIVAEQEVEEGSLDSTSSTASTIPKMPGAPEGWTWHDVSADIRYTNVKLAVDGLPKVSTP